MKPASADSPEPSPREYLAHGFAFPAEWTAPVLRVERHKADDWRIRELCGTATLIGNELLLTARHVFDESIARLGDLGDDEHFCLNIYRAAEERQTMRRVLDREPHDDNRYDLCMARVADWPVPVQWHGIALPTLGMEVHCYGLPVDLAEAGGSQGLELDARYLRGHITRLLNPGYGGVVAPGVELSFAITEGMSGAPIYAIHEDKRGLVGIAIGTRASHIRQHQSLFADPHQTPKEIYRVVEYGIAIRLAALVHWQPSLLEGESLGGHLTPNGASGAPAGASPA